MDRHCASPVRILGAVSLALAFCVSCNDRGGVGGSGTGHRHGFVQFQVQPDAATIDQLAGSGIRITAHEIGTTYVASIGEGAAERIAETPGASLLGAIPLAAKVSPEVLAGRLSAWSKDDRGRALLWIRFHSDVSGKEAKAAALAAGAEILDEESLAPFGILHVAIPPDAVAGVAALDAVRRVDEIEPPKTSANYDAAFLSNVFKLWMAPYGDGGTGLSGAGYSVGIWEQTRVFPHPEFAGRLTYHSDVASNTDYSLHGTHVSGTIGAAGLDWGAHGMAGAVAIRSYNWTNPAPEYLGAAADGLVASNNSWGYKTGWEPDGTNWGQEGFGAYRAATAAMDDAVWQADQAGDLMAVAFSSGNHRNDYNPSNPSQHDGKYFPDPSIVNPYYDTIPYSATGKNVITVGAVMANGSMTDFSSIGPVDDGRIKPDIVAKGHNQYSTTFNETTLQPTYQGGWNGTSMACPVVTGTVALLVEQFELAFGRRPNLAEVKALLLNSTIDLGRPGPDYVYGFGLLHAAIAADAILADGGTGTRIRLDAVAHQTHEAYHFEVAPGSGPVRITLAWVDPAGAADNAAPDIVNNLDLRLLAPDGTVHHPFRLDPRNPVSNATADGPNLVDTVEQIVVSAPQPGFWQVEVAGSSVVSGVLQRFGLASSHALTPGWFIEELQNLELDLDGEGNTVLTWPAVDNPDLVEFRVFRSTNFGQSWALAAVVAPSGNATETWTDTAAPDVPLVFYDVRALLNVSGQDVFDANPGALQTHPPSILEPAEGSSVPYTGTPTPVLGLSEPGATVTLYDGGLPIGSVSADGDGLFTFNQHIFAAGQHALTASAQLAGHAASVPTAERHFTVE